MAVALISILAGAAKDAPLMGELITMDGGRLLGVEGLLGLLDQREHVAHAQNPARHPVRMEHVEVRQRLAIGGEHDRTAGDAGDREGSTAASVTIQLGEYDPVETNALGERVRCIDGVLADHGVDDE